MIDQRRCKYIKTIAECSSFSKAAEVLYVSQPSLSRMVKRLEAELGVPLFDRNSVPLVLTDAGKCYIDYIGRFEALEEIMYAEFSHMSTGISSQLTISSLPFLGTYILPKVIPRFSDLHRSINFDIQEKSSRQLLPHLEDGRADIALTNLMPDPARFTACRICSDHIMIVAAYNQKMRELFPDVHTDPDYPMETDLSLLRGETLIVLLPHQNMRTATDAICKHFAFRPHSTLEVPSLSTAVSLVCSNRGITFVCKSSISCIQPQTPLIYFSLGKMANYTSILAVYKKFDENPLIQSFCECATHALRPTENKTELPLDSMD